MVTLRYVPRAQSAPERLAASEPAGGSTTRDTTGTRYFPETLRPTR
jgi:hypothetical protein